MSDRERLTSPFTADPNLQPLLQPGDRVRVISPSGGLRQVEPFQQGIEIWQAQGYRVELSSGFDDQWGYLAGTDAARCHQLLEALADETCSAILCSRGGYGGARLLETLSSSSLAKFQAINLNNNPHRSKFLIGFSDVTALLWGLRQQVSGIHGPVLTTLAQEPDWSIQRLFQGLSTGTWAALKGSGWGGGQGQGWLLPGNLTVATHLLGTPYQPDFTGAILAFEDVNEEPYRVDRMLTQWRMLGVFTRFVGSPWDGLANGKKPQVPTVSPWQRSGAIA